uniref:Uncharacterized protein n=1 Tax=Nelumbo nucifera TaxID=4432 RepID=A0A822YT54_NELNU|nr:TPA_asm: hypothetical protein HUJ06_005239 [Nelumbo nucifera]
MNLTIGCEASRLAFDMMFWIVIAENYSPSFTLCWQIENEVVSKEILLGHWKCPTFVNELFLSISFCIQI